MPVAVPDTSASGRVLVAGGVVLVALQNVVHWLNWSSRYERSVILSAVEVPLIQELQPARSFMKAESVSQSSADFPICWASDKALSQTEKHVAGMSSLLSVWRSRRSLFV